MSNKTAIRLRFENLLMGNLKFKNLKITGY